MKRPDGSVAPTPRISAVPAVPTPPARAYSSDRVPALVWVIAAVFVAVELAVSGRYGFQQDELYFLVAGHHLAFGYVDQPPLAPLLTRITGVLGVSPTAIRIIPALAGGAIVIMAARLAALFGAGRFGRVLAALTTACAPVIIGAVHVGNTTPLDLLAWTAVLVCVSTALLRDRPRWWLAAGAAAGVGLEADNLVVLLLIGLAIGLLVSPQRPVLRTRWPWLGAGIAAVIWAPNVIWQATHGWPQLAMSAALHHENTSPADYAGGLPGQLVYLGLRSSACRSYASGSTGADSTSAPDTGAYIRIAYSATVTPSRCQVAAYIPTSTASTGTSAAATPVHASHSLRPARADRVMPRNSDDTMEASWAACSSARWTSAGLFARSTWYSR